MKHVVILLLALTVTACVKRVQVQQPTITQGEGYVVVQTTDGVYAILSRTRAGAENGVKAAHIGPATVEEWYLFVLEGIKK